MRKFNYLFVGVLILASSAAHCQVATDVYCFDSGAVGAKDFELHVLSDDAENWSGAFVKYRGATSPISLVPKQAVSEELSKGRPDQVTTTWYEVFRGKITGEYEMMSQGANIYSMTYESYSSHKPVAFIFNPDERSGDGKGCSW